MSAENSAGACFSCSEGSRARVLDSFPWPGYRAAMSDDTLLPANRADLVSCIGRRRTVLW